MANERPVFRPVDCPGLIRLLCALCRIEGLKKDRRKLRCAADGPSRKLGGPIIQDALSSAPLFCVRKESACLSRFSQKSPNQFRRGGVVAACRRLDPPLLQRAMG